MPDEYKVRVVDLGEGEVVDETFDPLYSREEAVRAADDRAAADRGDNASGLGYEVVVARGGDASRVIYWAAHTGGGVVDSGTNDPPWQRRF